MKRRNFLKSASAVAIGATMPLPAIWSQARADARSETLLVVSENGPNNLDIHGVGTNRPGYEASWNTYDRLLTFGVRSDASGNEHYDYAKLEPELAEEWDVGEMSATFKLRKGAKFHDGTP